MFRLTAHRFASQTGSHRRRLVCFLQNALACPFTVIVQALIDADFMLTADSVLVLQHVQLAA